MNGNADHFHDCEYFLENYYEQILEKWFGLILEKHEWFLEHLDFECHFEKQLGY